ncbi:MAG: PfkB family carbohydrate kinase, partial [Candidatus Dormibacteria bacterium]
AMTRAAGISIQDEHDIEHVVVAADAPAAMTEHIRQATEMGARLVFAPAQQIPSLDDETLRAGLEAAWMISANAYEMELLRARTGLRLDDLSSHAIVAVTRGGDGSELHGPTGVVAIPVAPATTVVDPTGAGDAYLAGLLAAIRSGRPLDVAGRVAALAAAYVVELGGTQSHTYGVETFAQRYQEAFGSRLPPLT